MKEEKYNLEKWAAVTGRMAKRNPRSKTP